MPGPQLMLIAMMQALQVRDRAWRCAGALVKALLPLLVLSQSLITASQSVAMVAGSTLFFCEQALARPSSSGSGGYSRPSGGGLRTPSFGGFSGSRTPSTGSGGYSRPQSSGDRYGSGFFGGSSTDRAMSRQSSKEALDAYQSPGRDSSADYSRRPSTSSDDYGWGQGRRRSGGWSAPSDYGWRRSSSWSPPPYVARGPSRYGLWDAAMLWFLLESVSKPGHADFFYHHADDPGYQRWRADAEARAASDPDVREQLRELDQRVAQMEGQPRSADYLPADVADRSPSPNALRQSRNRSSGFGTFILIIVVAVLIYLGWRALSGDVAKRKNAGNTPSMKSKSEQKGFYQPNNFRVGMSFPLDPTPFILATGATKITAPAGASGSGLISVEQVGQVRSGDITWHRLYLPGGTAFFQVHMADNGTADECRYFSRLDEVNPGGRDEWNFWLDPVEGMIGWPEFETKDGALYRRVWAGAAGRVAPRQMDEYLTDVNGSVNRSHQSMLYARQTGLSAPSPEAEYLLVTAIEATGGAWVELSVGIDVSASLLQLA